MLRHCQRATLDKHVPRSNGTTTIIFGILKFHKFHAFSKVIMPVLIMQTSRQY